MNPKGICSINTDTFYTKHLFVTLSQKIGWI